MVEFWWGLVFKLVICKYGYYYLVCRGKCEFIFLYMLVGMEVVFNFLVEDWVQVDELEIVYEDEYFVLINKFVGFLVVFGKSWIDLVFIRMCQWYFEVMGFLVVYCLDMLILGLMLVVKDKDMYKQFQ